MNKQGNREYIYVIGYTDAYYGRDKSEYYSDQELEWYKEGWDEFYRQYLSDNDVWVEQDIL